MTKPALKLRRRKIDFSQEKKLITNLITSTEFCQEIIPLINLRLLKADDSKNAFKWVQSYFLKYQEAPKSNLKSLFDEAMVDESEAVIELTSSFLTNLSSEYEQLDLDDVNIEYEIDQAREYLRRRGIEVTIDEAKLLLKKDRLEKAEEVLKKHSENIITSSSLLSKIQALVIGQKDFQNTKIPEPAKIISPWLTDGSISMIYGPKGAGKTWLALYIATAISAKKGMGQKIGPWEVMQRSGVLYIDGEMGEYDLQSRQKALIETIGPAGKEYPFDFLTAAGFANKHGKQLNISTDEWRKALYDYIRENEQYQVLILDNIASLTPGINENEKEAWDPVNQWLLSLKHLNVATIFVHHAGKGGAQRGTSGREDAVDCTIKLTRPEGYKASQGCKFKVSFEKSRNVRSGEGLNSFIFQLRENENDRLVLETDEMESSDREDDKDIIKGLLLEKGLDENTLTQKQIAKAVGVTPTTVKDIKKELEKIGLIRSGQKNTGVDHHE